MAAVRSAIHLSPLSRFLEPPLRELVERFYTLGPDDLVQVYRRRRGANRIGYAVQFCYLRHPGRALAPGETPPATMLSLLCDQVGGDPTEFEHYAARGPTLREHRAEIEALLGLRAFERPDLRAMLAVGIEVAASTDRGETIVAVMAERLRATRVVVPAASVEYATLEWVNWFNHRPTARTHRQHPAPRSRRAILCCRGPDRYGGVTHNHRPPANPARFHVAVLIRSWAKRGR